MFQADCTNASKQGSVCPRWVTHIDCRTLDQMRRVPVVCIGSNTWEYSATCRLSSAWDPWLVKLLAKVHQQSHIRLCMSFSEKLSLATTKKPMKASLSRGGLVYLEYTTFSMRSVHFRPYFPSRYLNVVGGSSREHLFREQIMRWPERLSLPPLLGGGVVLSTRSFPADSNSSTYP